MKQGALILIIAMAVLLTGCVLSAKQTQKASATPPAVKPAVAAPAAPAPQPSAPLSIPQTEARLPAPQPINPEALAVAKPAEEPVESQPAPRPPPRRAAGPPRAEPTPVAPQQPAAVVVAAPQELEQRPALQEILPPAELNRFKDSAENRKRGIRKVLDQQDARRLNDSQRALVTRIRTFVQQSDEAEGRGEMKLADALAERAEVLVRELQGGR